MASEVRYSTTEDGVRIAYSIEGEGPALVFCPNFVGSFSLAHLVPTWQAFFEEIGRGRKLVRYDMRGTGLSQHDVTDFSGPSLELDVDAVVRAAGVERFALWGAQFSGPRCIAYAAHHPDQVTHLILASTFARPVEAFPREAATSLAELCLNNWTLAAQVLTDMGGRRAVSDPGERQLFSELSVQVGRLTEQSTDGRAVASLILEAYESWDVAHLLSQVRAKTLLFHHLGDGIFPISLGRSLAAEISDAVFVPLEGARSNVGYDAEETRVVVSALNRFLDEGREDAIVVGSATGLQIVLFTDIESSTALTQRLGDERAQELVRAHDAIVREALAAHGGSEIKHTGDGIMASFSTASSALLCAVAIQRGVAAGSEPDLRVHVGLNAGEPLAEDDPAGRGDLFGTTVQLARRICDHASGGEIVVANVVRELAAGKGFTFADLGSVALKGFNDPVRLYELVWRDDAPARRRYPDGLTEREVEVLRLIAAGKSNSEIADELVLSVRTVERHITNVYGKIGAHGKADATRYALEHGLS